MLGFLKVAKNIKISHIKTAKKFSYFAELTPKF